MGIFWHWNELTPYQVALMIDTLKASGATLMSNTQLVNYLLSTQQNSGTTYYADGATGTVDARPTRAFAGGESGCGAGFRIQAGFDGDRSDGVWEWVGDWADGDGAGGGGASEALVHSCGKEKSRALCRKERDEDGAPGD